MTRFHTAFAVSAYHEPRCSLWLTLTLYTAYPTVRRAQETPCCGTRRCCCWWSATQHAASVAWQPWDWPGLEKESSRPSHTQTHTVCTRPKDKTRRAAQWGGSVCGEQEQSVNPWVGERGSHGREGGRLEEEQARPEENCRGSSGVAVGLL